MGKRTAPDIPELTVWTAQVGDGLITVNKHAINWSGTTFPRMLHAKCCAAHRIKIRETTGNNCLPLCFRSAATRSARHRSDTRRCAPPTRSKTRFARINMEDSSRLDQKLASREKCKRIMANLTTKLVEVCQNKRTFLLSYRYMVVPSTVPKHYKAYSFVMLGE